VTAPKVKPLTRESARHGARDGRWSPATHEEIRATLDELDAARGQVAAAAEALRFSKTELEEESRPSDLALILAKVRAALASLSTAAAEHDARVRQEAWREAIQWWLNRGHLNVTIEEAMTALKKGTKP
jgi:hypothetical protein